MYNFPTCRRIWCNEGIAGRETWPMSSKCRSSGRAMTRLPPAPLQLELKKCLDVLLRKAWRHPGSIVIFLTQYYCFDVALPFFYQDLWWDSKIKLSPSSTSPALWTEWMRQVHTPQRNRKPRISYSDSLFPQPIGSGPTDPKKHGQVARALTGPGPAPTSTLTPSFAPAWRHAEAQTAQESRRSSIAKGISEETLSVFFNSCPAVQRIGRGP